MNLDKMNEACKRYRKGMEVITDSLDNELLAKEIMSTCEEAFKRGYITALEHAKEEKE